MPDAGPGPAGGVICRSVRFAIIGLMDLTPPAGTGESSRSDLGRVAHSGLDLCHAQIRTAALSAFVQANANSTPLQMSPAGERLHDTCVALRNWSRANGYGDVMRETFDVLIAGMDRSTTAPATAAADAALGAAGLRVFFGNRPRYCQQVDLPQGMMKSSCRAVGRRILRPDPGGQPLAANPLRGQKHRLENYPCRTTTRRSTTAITATTISTAAIGSMNRPGQEAGLAQGLANLGRGPVDGGGIGAYLASMDEALSPVKEPGQKPGAATPMPANAPAAP